MSSTTKSTSFKITIIAGVIVLLVIIAFFVFKDKAIQYFAKKFAPTDIKLNTQTGQNTQALIVFGFNNDLIPSFADSMSYTIILDEDTIGLGSKNFHEKNPKDTIFTIPITIDQKTYLKRLRNSKGEAVKINFEGKLYVFNNKLWKDGIAVQKEIDWKMPIQPEIKIDSVKFEKLSFKESSALAYIKITNHNDFEIKITPLYYNFTVKDFMKIDGENKEPVTLKPHQTSTTILAMEIDKIKFGKMLKLLIKEKGIMPFNVDVIAKVHVEDQPIDNIDLNATISGEINLKERLLGKD